MLEVEDWTQPSYPSKRRESSKKLPPIDPPLETVTQPIPASEAIPIPTGPPEPEVEESFSATRPPTSRLFPRNRSASSPTAGPSSLSRLLAQAGPSDPPTSSSLGLGLASADGKTSSDETLPLLHPRVASPTAAASPPDHDDHSPEASRSVSPNVPISPPAIVPSQPSLPQPPVPPHSPTRPTQSPAPGAEPRPVNNHIPSQPSPLRSTSRASRGSGSSRFSRGIPIKAVPTTAITEQAVSTLSTTPSSASGSATSDHTLGVRPIPGALGNGVGTSTIPSPEGSPTLGMTSLLSQSHRRRTTSYHLPNPRVSTTGLSSPTATANPSSPLAGVGIGATASSRLASLASSWGVSFGRRRRSELLQGEQAASGSGRAPGGSSPIPESPTQGAD